MGSVTTPPATQPTITVPAGRCREWPAGPAGSFDAALTGTVDRLQLADGRTISLATQRWQATAAPADQWMLDRCHGPTIDLGCGPGRLVAALHARGVAALGVDSSTLAMRHCASRRAPAVHRDVFEPLPGEARWRHVLLADGNIGIGGDPAALLRRAAALLRPDGTILVELAPRGALWRGAARLRGGRVAGPWFPWAVVGPDAVTHLARRAGLLVTDVLTRRRRCFAELGTDRTAVRA
jgi:SAM-dependent methyltransferase